MSWRDVFDSQKIWPFTYPECRLIAESNNYKYLAFNGIVYATNDFDMVNPICDIEDLQ